MRAVLMTAVGGPEVLQVAELPEPQITGEREVKVRLRAAGINPVDYKLRSSGTIGGSLPVVLGVDGAGVVEATGPAVTRFKNGDEVYFVDGGYGPTPGTYQEVKIIDERLLARKPERLSFVEAAAAPLVTITAWEALRGRARVEPGQRDTRAGRGPLRRGRAAGPGRRRLPAVAGGRRAPRARGGQGARQGGPEDRRLARHDGYRDA
jgi:NADPH:quinone reductase